MRGIATLAAIASLALASAAAADGAATEGFRVRVEAGEKERAWLAAEGYDIAGHDLPHDRVEVLTDAEGLARLGERGLVHQVIERWDGPVPLGGGIDAPLGDTQYTDPSELATFLNQVAADHPAITRLETLGFTHDSRPILALMISDNAAQDEDELSVLFSGAHHSREVMTPEVVMDTIDYLTDNYPADPDVAAAVDNYQIWCVPMVNPDGVDWVFTVDQNWRKNLRDNDSSGTIDFNDGVDLNRNYEWGFGGQCQGSSSTPSSLTYRGPWEGSEPEVQAMIALGRRITPVFDVEYHSYGEDVLYATSCDPNVFSPQLSTIASGPDHSISRVVAEAYAAEIVQADGGFGYFPAPYGSPVDGVGRDQQYHENGAVAFVVEVNTSSEGGFRPSYTTWRDATVQGLRAGWLWLLGRLAGPAVGGHVLDAVTGLPVRADVALDELSLPDGKRLTSRADTGRFHLLVVPGSYTLRVSAPGYDAAAVNVAVGSAFAPVQVDLVPTGATRILADDFEDAGSAGTWSLGDPADTATSGTWVWGEPEGTQSGSVPGGNLLFGNARFDRTPGGGRRAFVTGNAVGATLASDDVDGGVTTLTSPSFDLSGWYAVEVSWHRWLRKDAADPADALVAQVSSDGGSSWHDLEVLTETTSTPDASPAWSPVAVRLDDIVAPGPDVRLRFRASDTGADHVVEAAFDDLAIHGFSRDVQGRITGVRLSGGGGATVLDWDAVPGAPDAVYDVVRGDLADVAGGAGGVTLGALTCVENDSSDATTAGNADASIPAAGRVSFYLVRFNLGLSVGGYGAGSQGGERTGSGGCAP